MAQDDHYHVGQEHARARLPRYKFQAQHLQAEYDRGYDSIRRDEVEECEQREQREEFARRLMARQQTGWRKF